ncbi:hypothetical protein BC832DRAFT_391536 [Gaertneriomyces semiglobifer]|nr:hypothetical protein BC832DRAFT_391536 [Gaertneriomyces semiglobifer]
MVPRPVSCASGNYRGKPSRANGSQSKGQRPRRNPGEKATQCRAFQRKVLHHRARQRTVASLHQRNIKRPPSVKTMKPSALPTEASLNAIRLPVFLDVETDMAGKEPEVDSFFEAINASQQFLGFQKAAFRIGQTQGLTFESHVHEMSALSSVLLVKPAEHSRVQRVEFFQQSFLDRFGGHVLASIGLAPSELTDELQLFLRKTCTEVAALGVLSDSLDARILDRMISQPKEKRILDTFRTLLRDLPKKKINMASYTESDLIASYLHSFMKLFFGRNALVRLSWLNTASTAAVQARTEMAQSGQARQPDMIMFTVKASREHQEVGYGEVKVQSRQEDTFALNVDLYRLGKFAIDRLGELP